MDPRVEAKRSFGERVEQNPYPGRGLVVGRAADGAWLQVYWIMGRSEHSRNRRFVAEGTTLRTEPVDAGKVEDPSLILYEAMLEAPGCYLVSNGDQTRTLLEALSAGASFEAALATREREPDAPNYTPRISGMLALAGGDAELRLSLLRANAHDPARTDRFSFQYAPPARGLGLGLTTYEGDGSPLPSFRGEPLWLPLEGGAEDVLGLYWEALDRENRVALAVKRIAPEGGPGRILLRNRYGDA